MTARSAPVLFAQHRAVWARQANWYVDPANGDDRNAGDVLASPLKTLAELERRIGGIALEQTTAVWLLGDCAEWLELELSLDPQVSGRFIVAGHPDAWQAVDTGTITGVTPPVKNAVPSNALQLTATFASAPDWSTYLGLRCRMLDGPNAGGVFWPVKELSPGVARCAEGASKFDVFTSVAGFNFTPGMGETFAVERLPGLYGADVRLRSPRGSGTFGGKNRLIVADLEIGTGLNVDDAKLVLDSRPHVLLTDVGWVAQCRILARAIDAAGLGLYNCGIDVTTAASSVTVQLLTSVLRAGACRGAMRVSSLTGALTILGGYILQDGFAAAAGWRCSCPWQILVGGFGVFDSQGNAIYLAGLEAAHANVAAELFGAGASGFGVKVDGGSTMTIAAGQLPAIAGSGGEASAGASSDTWANVQISGGLVDATRLAGIVFE